MKLEDWVRGVTAARRFVLTENGVPFNLTGFTVTLELRRGDAAGTPVDTSGDITVLAQSGADVGAVTYTPDATDLDPALGEAVETIPISPVIGDFVVFYRRARFKVADGGGLFDYFPKGEPWIWRIYRVQG